MMLKAGTVQQTAGSRADVLDTLDDICEEVETVLYTNRTLSGNAIDIRLDGTEIELDGTGEAPVGTATMAWVVVYEVDRDGPTI